MQVFDLAAVAAERRLVREREARAERLRRRAKVVEPTMRTASGRCAHASKPVSRPVA